MGEHRKAWVRFCEAQEGHLRADNAGAKGPKRVPISRSGVLWRKKHTAYEKKREEDNKEALRKGENDPALRDLNPEQRRAVIIQEDRTLIIAGPGTGKTHTMVAKARDTVHIGIARAEEIACATFTRKATQELHARCHDLPGMEIGTLHHLARVVIKRKDGKGSRLSPLATDESARLTQIEAWLLESVEHDQNLLGDLETRRHASVSRQSAQGVRVLPDKVLVRSVGEATIATTLHLADINYRYEAEFPVPDEHLSREGKRYFPDFYLPDNPNGWSKDYRPGNPHAGVWLEHFANDMNNKLPEHWDEDEVGAIAKYRKERLWKLALHQALETRFARTEFGDIQRCMETGTAFTELVLERIAKQGKTGFKSPSQWDVRSVIERMKTENANAQYMQATLEIDAWIRTRRQQVHDEKTITDKIAKHETVAESGALYRLARPVLERYERHLKDTNTDDHEGTILKAWRYLRKGTVKPPWKVILIDEYQDVNPAQAAFVHALLEPTDAERPSSRARLTAVGDDWQAIFGFQGGDVDLIRTFKDPANAHEGETRRVELKQTYRFGQPIADSTRHFVTRGREPTKRKVIGAPRMEPDPRWPRSIVIASSSLTAEGERRLGAHHRGLTGGVLAALERIGQQSEETEVLVIARRNAELEMPPEKPPEATGINRNTITVWGKANGIKVNYSTIHKAKGTEADYVILLDGGTPRAAHNAKDRALRRGLSVFQGRDTAAEEERRIWYVALTRAKRKVYIIVSGDSHSPFADELYQNEDGQYDIGKDELAELLEPMEPKVRCPVCELNGRTDSVLIVRQGPMGQFAGCTSFLSEPDHQCGHTERTCERCGQGLMTRPSNSRARCQNLECLHEAPLCRCTTPRPMVERQNKETGRRFWGCQRYGGDESCGMTKNWSESKRHST